MQGLSMLSSYTYICKLKYTFPIPKDYQLNKNKKKGSIKKKATTKISFSSPRSDKTSSHHVTKASISKESTVIFDLVNEANLSSKSLIS